MKMILLVLALVAVTACSPRQTVAFDAAETVVENRVDGVVDRVINRICSAPIDVAVRAAERHPALARSIFDLCPETYGRLRQMLFMDALQRMREEPRIQ